MPFKKHDIFLSYSSKDKSRIRPLVKSLEQEGWSVWWDNKIPAGKTFDRFIEENLIASTTVIVVWSKNAIESDWVRVEAAEGKADGRLIPVKIDNISIPLAFKRIQTANLSNWKKGKTNEPYQLFINSVWDYFWNLAQELDTPEAYQSYISKFPNGPKTKLAQSKLGNTTISVPPIKKGDNSTKSIPPVNPSSAEDDLWKEAKKRNTIYAYNKYLKKYKDGKFADDAKEQKKKIKIAKQKIAKSNEKLIWLAAKYNPNIDKLKNFILSNPKSDYLEEAKQLLQKLEATPVEPVEPIKTSTPKPPPKPPVQNPPTAKAVKASHILKILHRYKGTKGFLTYPDITPEQDKIIRSRIKNIPQGEKIMAYIPTTMLGGLGNGMAFTTQRIIWMSSWGFAPSGCDRRGQILYKEFSKTTFKTGPSYAVLMGGKNGFDSSGWSELENFHIVEILNTIKKLFLQK